MSDRLALLVEIEASARQLLAEVATARAALDPGLSGAADRAQGGLEDVGAAGEQGGRRAAAGVREVGDAATHTSGLVGDLKSELGALVSLGALAGLTTGAVQEARKLEATFRGLQGISRSLGIDIAASWQTATALSADGLMTVQEAAQSLSQLLQRGYSMDQATATIGRLKDAAAYGRAAQLGLGEAVVTATEGLKQENSILVDNAGVTKNVAKMWEEYAQKIGVASTDLTQAQKVQAEYNGIMAETAAQMGDAARASQGMEGDLAKLNKAINESQAAFGAALFPALETLATSGTAVMNGFVNPLLAGFEKAGVYLGALSERIGILLDGFKSRDPAQIMDAWERSSVTVAESVAMIDDRYRQGVTPAIQAATNGTNAFKGATDGAAKAAAGLGQASKGAMKAAADQAKETAAITKALGDAVVSVRDEFSKYGQIPKPEVPKDISYLEVAMKQAEASRALANGDASAAMALSRQAGEALTVYAQGVNASSALAAAQLGGLRKMITDTAVAAQELSNSKVFKENGITEIKLSANKAVLVSSITEAVGAAGSKEVDLRAGPGLAASIQAAVASVGVVDVPYRLVPVGGAGGQGVTAAVAAAAAAAGGRP